MSHFSYMELEQVPLSMEQLEQATQATPQQKARTNGPCLEILKLRGIGSPKDGFGINFNRTSNHQHNKKFASAIDQASRGRGCRVNLQTERRLNEMAARAAKVSPSSLHPGKDSKRTKVF